ncbi:MAG TPA: dihydroorotate dehydrogenase [Acidimicrobiia bacterium]
MASPGLTTKLGPIELRTPLVAASGTVGSVWEWADTTDVSHYGAAVAKSVSPEPWPGRPVPRLAPTRAGMLNGVGIQNPGIAAWAEEMAPRLAVSDVPVWGSAVAGDAAGFAEVALGLQEAGVAAIEVNLSCPNLDDGVMFSFDPTRAGDVVSAVRNAVSVPVGAKLSPNTPDIVAVSAAVRDHGADFVVLTNTALGFGIDVTTARPLLSGGVGGYSGPGLKPISLRCVYEVATALPGLPILGCGGVMTGSDIVEYLMAGASAVAAGTIHFAEPKAGRRLMGELQTEMSRIGVDSPADLVGMVRRW